MFVIWQTGTKSEECGELMHHCQNCGGVKRHTVIITYDYWGIFWVFNTFGDSSYLLSCEVCNTRLKLDDELLDRSFGDFLKRSPMNHVGCLFLAGIIVLIAVTAIISVLTAN